MNEAGRSMSSSWKCIDTAAKGSQRLEIRHGTGADFKTRLGAITMAGQIVEPKIMVEGIRPELGVQCGARKDSTKSILDSSVRAFAGAGLMGQISSSGFNGVASFLEKRANITATTKFTTKIHPNIFISDVLATAMLCEPAIDEIERWWFIAKGLTIKGTTLVIREKNIAAFTIEPKQTLHTLRIVGFLDDESNIDGNALITDGGTARIGFTTSMLGELFLSADGTRAQLGVSNGQFWKPNDMLLECVHTSRVKMPKSVMPKDPMLLSSQGMNYTIIGDSISKGRISVSIRELRTFTRTQLDTVRDERGTWWWGDGHTKSALPDSRGGNWRIMLTRARCSGEVYSRITQVIIGGAIVSRRRSRSNSGISICVQIGRRRISNLFSVRRDRDRLDFWKRDGFDFKSTNVKGGTRACGNMLSISGLHQQISEEKTANGCQREKEILRISLAMVQA
jgi:hypothetical protein